MKPIRRDVRQGQTRWLAVLYKPGTFSDFPDQHVAMVHPCFVTAAFGTTVKYETETGPYMCGREWFLKNTQPSYRRALKLAQSLVDSAGFFAT